MFVFLWFFECFVDWIGKQLLVYEELATVTNIIYVDHHYKIIMEVIVCFLESLKPEIWQKK